MDGTAEVKWFLKNTRGTQEKWSLISTNSTWKLNVSWNQLLQIKFKGKHNNYSTQFIVRFFSFFFFNVVWPLLNYLKCWPQNPGLLCGWRKINGNPPKETGSLHVAMGSTFDQSYMLQPPIIVLRRDLYSHFILAAFQRGTGGFRAFSWVTNQIIFHGFHL